MRLLFDTGWIHGAYAPERANPYAIFAAATDKYPNLPLRPGQLAFVITTVADFEQADLTGLAETAKLSLNFYMKETIGKCAFQTPALTRVINKLEVLQGVEDLTLEICPSKGPHATDIDNSVARQIAGACPKLRKLCIRANAERVEGSHHFRRMTHDFEMRWEVCRGNSGGFKMKKYGDNRLGGETVLDFGGWYT
jgi:hypothetical protein